MHNEEAKALFLHSLYKSIKENPDWSGDAITAITRGVTEAIHKERAYARDMETMASAFYSALDKRYKKSNKEWFDRLIRRKVLDNQDKLGCIWEQEDEDVHS